MAHIPVLVKETLEYLNARQAGTFMDGTVGDGGHTIAILQSNPDNKVLGIDLDQASQNKLQQWLVRQGLDQRTILVHGNYADLDLFIHKQQWTNVGGILLDLGFSSVQLNDPGRGFSFQTDGPLDMRFDVNNVKTAAAVVNTYSLRQLERIFKDYGEERLAAKIARVVVDARQVGTIRSTIQLADIIKQALPKPIRHKAADFQRRIFQALRIEVNQELENLKTALPKALKFLKPGGRIVVISFHSLEDRIVKQFFNQEAKDCVCPPKFPTCICGKAQRLKVLTRKPITASEEEIHNNPRSKPAKLRAAEKIM